MLRHDTDCPKCGQPIDSDDGSYVCCADAIVSWRCTRCSKVSDGFAMPHGVCPACGGTLLRVVTGPVLDEAVEAVRTAVQIELGGRAFYRAAAAASHGQLSELFEAFAAMEDDHLETLARRYHVYLDDTVGESPLRAATMPHDPDSLFAEAIAFEQRAVEFFTERATGAPGAARDLYEELAAEEREHVDLLKTERDRWLRAVPGLL
jgi:glutamate synthase (NADPH) small chain